MIATYQSSFLPVEHTLFEQVLRFCVLMYLRFEKSGHWDDYGEPAIKASFCRLVLGIPADMAIDPDHVDEFRYTLDRLAAHFNLDALSLDELNEGFDSFALTFEDKRYTIHDLIHLQRYISHEGSDWIIQGGTYGHAKEMIVGTGSKEVHGEYMVYHIKHEIVRTPNTIVAMAAVIGDKEIYIRRESLETIFYQKWKANLNYYLNETPMYSDAFRIGHLLKRYTLQCNTLITESAFDTQKEIFLDELYETVFHHELGHGVIQHHVLPIEVATLAEATKICGENIVTTFLEVLADWAPKVGDMQGPLVNICDIALSDPEKATRMFWTYASDTWFYDTTESFMFLYSGLVHYGYLLASNEDLTVNWEQLRYHLTFTPGATDTFTSWAVSMVVSMIGQLRSILERTIYDLDGTAKTYDEIQSYYHEKDSQDSDHDHDSEYMAKTSMWTHVLNHAYTKSDHCDAIKNLLSSTELHTEIAVLAAFPRPWSDGMETVENAVYNRFTQILPNTNLH